MFRVMDPDMALEPGELHIPQWEVGIRKDFHHICLEASVPKQDDGEGEWTVSKIQDNGRLHLLNRVLLDKQVPNVVGMGLRDALYVLENSGLNVGVIGVGKVRRQSIQPGTAARGQYIKIFLE